MKTPYTHPDDFVSFAIIVDGEVVHHLTLQKEQEMHIAIFSSEPKFIPVKPNDQPPIGSRWNGQDFEEPYEDWE